MKTFNFNKSKKRWPRATKFSNNLNPKKSLFNVDRPFSLVFWCDLVEKQMPPFARIRINSMGIPNPGIDPKSKFNSMTYSPNHCIKQQFDRKNYFDYKRLCKICNEFIPPWFDLLFNFVLMLIKLESNSKKDTKFSNILYPTRLYKIPKPFSLVFWCMFNHQPYNSTGLDDWAIPTTWEIVSTNPPRWMKWLQISKAVRYDLVWKQMPPFA